MEISTLFYLIQISGMGSLQNLGNRGSSAAQQLAAQLSRSGGSSNLGSHQQGMLGGSGGLGSSSSWGTGGGRLTPTSAVSSSSAVSAAPGMAHLFSSGGSGGFPSGFPGQQTQQPNIPSSTRQSTFGMSLLQSSSGQGSTSVGTPGLNALSSGSFSSFSAASATGMAGGGSSERLFSRVRGGKM